LFVADRVPKIISQAEKIIVLAGIGAIPPRQQLPTFLMD
jgi:hypothetical protein